MIPNDKFGKCERVMKQPTGFDKEKIMKLVGELSIKSRFLSKYWC